MTWAWLSALCWANHQCAFHPPMMRAANMARVMRPTHAAMEIPLMNAMNISSHRRDGGVCRVELLGVSDLCDVNVSVEQPLHLVDVVAATQLDASREPAKELQADLVAGVEQRVGVETECVVADVVHTLPLTIPGGVDGEVVHLPLGEVRGPAGDAHGGATRRSLTDLQDELRREPADVLVVPVTWKVEDVDGIDVGVRHAVDLDPRAHFEQRLTLVLHLSDHQDGLRQLLLGPLILGFWNTRNDIHHHTIFLPLRFLTGPNLPVRRLVVNSSPGWIRTTIPDSRGRCPAVRRPRKVVAETGFEPVTSGL